MLPDKVLPSLLCDITSTEADCSSQTRLQGFCVFHGVHYGVTGQDHQAGDEMGKSRHTRVVYFQAEFSGKDCLRRCGWYFPSRQTLHPDYRVTSLNTE